MLCDGACWAAQEVVAWCVGLTKGSRVSLAVVFGSLGNWGLSGPPGRGLRQRLRTVSLGFASSSWVWIHDPTNGTRLVCVDLGPSTITRNKFRNTTRKKVEL